MLVFYWAVSAPSCPARENPIPEPIIPKKQNLTANPEPMKGGWYFIAEQPARAPHLAHPEGCAALRIVLLTVPCVSRSCEQFPGGFDLHLLLLKQKLRIQTQALNLKPQIPNPEVLNPKFQA